MRRNSIKLIEIKQEIVEKQVKVLICEGATRVQAALDLYWNAVMAAADKGGNHEGVPVLSLPVSIQVHPPYVGDTKISVKECDNRS